MITRAKLVLSCYLRFVTSQNHALFFSEGSGTERKGEVNIPDESTEGEEEIYAFCRQTTGGTRENFEGGGLIERIAVFLSLAFSATFLTQSFIVLFDRVLTLCFASMLCMQVAASCCNE